jgi:hypothetical protein
MLTMADLMCRSDDGKVTVDAERTAAGTMGDTATGAAIGSLMAIATTANIAALKSVIAAITG